MRTSLSLLASFWLAALSPGVLAKMAPSPAYLEVSQVANSKELTPPEKVARLQWFTRKQETRMMALYQLESIDATAATDVAITLFRSADTPRPTKLQMGHFLLEGIRPQREGFPKEFRAEFAHFLVQSVVEGGEAEFCQKLEESPTTAVGEYAFLASDFDGYKGIDFAPFKDARVVPILIRCLDAPDNIFPANPACVIRGKPGEATGRNTARQQIPIALAKLGDARAIKPLETILFHHADIYPRVNSAYALARLIHQKEARAVIGQRLLAEPDLMMCRLLFGKGLIEAGDDTGVEFLSMKHVGVPTDRIVFPNELFYQLDQRLDILKDFRSPKVGDFIEETLDFAPWRDLVLFKPGSARIAPNDYLHPPKDEAEALDLCAPRIVRTYRAMLACVTLNKLKSLSEKLEEISRQSRSETIRKMTEESLSAIY